MSILLNSINSLSSYIIIMMVLQNTFYKCDYFLSNLHKILDLPLFFSFFDKNAFTTGWTKLT